LACCLSETYKKFDFYRILGNNEQILSWLVKNKTTLLADDVGLNMGTLKMPQTYQKKVLVIDEHSTAEARAERLRRLRNLANLSRKEMCNTDFLNINTLKAWELARFGGLPKDGANKVIMRVAQEGVTCSIDWLLYGKGESPRLENYSIMVKTYKRMVHDMRTPLATIGMGVSTALEVLESSQTTELGKIIKLLANALGEVDHLNIKLEQFIKMLKEYDYEY